MSQSTARKVVDLGGSPRKAAVAFSRARQPIARAALPAARGGLEQPSTSFTTAIDRMPTAIAAPLAMLT